MPGGLGTTTRNGRVIKLTPKMEGFLDIAKNGATAKLRQELIDKTSTVEKLLAQEQVNQDDLQSKYDEILADQSKLFESEETEVKELSDEEKDTYQEYFDDENMTIQQSKEQIKLHLDKEVTIDDKNNTNAKEASEKEKLLLIVEEKSRHAQLMLEKKRVIQQAEFDKEKRRLVEMQEDLIKRERLLAVEHELELSEAKIGILLHGSDAEDNKHPKGTKRGSSDVDQNKEKKKKLRPVDIVTSSPQEGYMPLKFDYTNRDRKLHDTQEHEKNEAPKQLEDVFNKLAAALDRNSRQTLQIEPQVFNGNILEYMLWKRNFEELVERDVKVERRFIYLLRYTSGEARECIDSLTHLDNVEAYAEGFKLLDERYGDKFLSFEAIREKLDTWPYIRDGEGLALRKFADFLSTCLSAMQKNVSLQVLDSMPENHKLLKKLPRRLMDKWGNKVDEWQYGGKHGNQANEYPPFQVFVEFIKKQARIELGPVKRLMNKNDAQKSKHLRVHQTGVEEGEEVECYNTRVESEECSCCGEAHNITTCSKFKAMATRERTQMSYNKKLCRGCLEVGHFAWACKNLIRCTKCQGRHHVLFHDDNFRPRNRNAQPEASEGGSEPKEKKVVLSTNIDGENVTAHIVPAYLSKNGDLSVARKVYVVIDNQSNACFISTGIAEAIQAEGRRTNVELHTMAGVEDIVLKKVEGLVIQDKNKKKTIKLPPTFIKDGMETDHSQIPSPTEVGRWNHLKKIVSELEEVDKSIEVGILIGRNCYEGTKLTDFIPSQGAEPYAVKTDLGWGIVGNLKSDGKKKKSTVWVHSTNLVEPSPAKFFDKYSVEFQDQHAELKISQDDVKFIKFLEEGLEITESGKLMLPLPMKSREDIPDNTVQALASLKGLKRKFEKDQSYKEKFVKKMNALFEKGHAELAPKTFTPGKMWHLTFHGVFHPKKVDELRVVFNGKREFMGFVLNGVLLQGPDLINSLIGVFCKFRKEKVTLTCDIEAMFYQVLVKPEDRDYLRFFWWPEGDTSKEPQEYRMMVHTFGATSSPGVATYSLNKVAELYEEKCGAEAATFIREGFYVDDGVTSKTDDEKAVELMKSSREMCGLGGFNLTKFSSNSRQVVEQIPMELRAKNLKALDLTKDRLPQGYTLGVFICNEGDHIRFQVQLKPMPRTRRGILSTVSQVYDPLGLVSPYLLEGKRILQQLCKKGKGWDEIIPDEELEPWEAWLEQMKELENIAFPRCYSDRGVEAAVHKELHHFADASLQGYGQCSYLRLVYEDGYVSSCLVMAKAKVLPKQTVTVPRLELAAAVLSVRMARFLQEQLNIPDVKHEYWSDSKVVLGYINNDSKRFHVFVANRVTQIREFSEPSQWHHVETDKNPADLASRGTSVAELKDSDLWRRGPDFLLKMVDEWQADSGLLLEDDVETRKVAAYQTIIVDEDDWEIKFVRFSTWKSLTRALGKIIQVSDANNDDDGGAVSLDDRKKGEMFAIKKTQEKFFKDEKKALLYMQKHPDAELPAVLKNGRLRKLDPFLDDAEIIRVGGRFKQGPWSFEMKHPVILPTEGQVSHLIIKYMHAQVAHSGREASMSALRASGYWILACRRKLDSIIWRCTICRRFRGGACKQKMGNLPAERLEEVPAFTHVGVDYFGPYSIKQGRSMVKRHIVIYTCLVTRATHLDKAYGMSSDEFINSYRRFVSRRGAVRTIRCDRGTNFIGAKDELERSLEDIVDLKTRQHLTDAGCEFVTIKLNPPCASHMGGVWERPIGTGKRVINILLKEHAHVLDDDLLDTVIAEAEAIMNSMPLVPVDTSGADSMKPLTPSMLLTMKPSVAPPPLQQFTQKEVYSRKRWKRAQYVVDEFWKRWRQELIPRWSERKKWNKAERNVVVGDVVLMMEDDVPRMVWQMAVVTETFPGDDGLTRSAKIRTKKSEYTRPIHKLLMLVERESNVD